MPNSSMNTVLENLRLYGREALRSSRDRYWEHLLDVYRPGLRLRRRGRKLKQPKRSAAEILKELENIV